MWHPGRAGSDLVWCAEASSLGSERLTWADTSCWNSRKRGTWTARPELICGFRPVISQVLARPKSQMWPHTLQIYRSRPIRSEASSAPSAAAATGETARFLSPIRRERVNAVLTSRSPKRNAGSFKNAAYPAANAWAQTGAFSIRASNTRFNCGCSCGMDETACGNQFSGRRRGPPSRQFERVHI